MKFSTVLNSVSRFGRTTDEVIFPALHGYVDTVSSCYKKRYDATQELLDQYAAIKRKATVERTERSLQRHVKLNKKQLLADRLKMLLDAESPFLEVATIAGHDMDYGDIPGAGSVVGIGKIRGQMCVVLGNDATVKGGTAYPINVKKQLRGQELAEQLKLPAVYLVDSGGAYLPLQADIFPDAQHGGRTFYNEAVLGSEGIPQISLVCGSCTAGGAYVPTLADDAIMVDKIGSLFLGGPPLVKAALGEVVDAETLGGATLHCSTSGCADYFSPNEQDAFNACRDVVSSLNFPGPESELRPNVDPSLPLFHPSELDGIACQNENGVKSEKEMNSLNKAHQFYQVASRILDRSRFREFRALFGDRLKTGFGYLEGYLVGIVGSSSDNFIDTRSALKASQFVQMCSHRNIPIIFIQNSLSPGWQQSDPGTMDVTVIKSVAQLMQAIACSNSPSVTLYIGGSFGIENYALCGRAFSPCFSFAWPHAQIGFCNPLSDDSDSPSSSLLNEFSAIHAASQLFIDDVIAPHDTREKLAQAVRCIIGIRTRTELLKSRMDSETSRASIRM